MNAQIEALSQHDRKALVKDLNDLLQLDLDAIAAYETTAERLENGEWAETVGIFKGDHERHVRDLTALVRRIGGEPARKPHVTGPAKAALVKMGDRIQGDKGVLQAFRVNELQVRAKYDKYASHQNYPAEAADLIRRNAQDERRHLDWVTTVLSAE